LGQFVDKSNLPDNMICRPAVVKSKWMRRSVVSKTDLLLNQFDASFNLESSLSKENKTTNDNDHYNLNYDNKALVSTKVCYISAGFDYSIAVTKCGAVFTWGCGSYGSHGQGSHCDVYLPKQVLTLNCEGISISSVQASHHTLFLSDSRLLFGCGLNNHNQVGSLPTLQSNNYKYDDISILYPRPILHISNDKDIILRDNFSFSTFKKISCGDFQSTAITNDNELLVWGNFPFLNNINIGNAVEKNSDNELDVTLLDVSIKTIRKLSDNKIKLKKYISNEYSDKAIYDMVSMDQSIVMITDL
jgi:alpha-tubulin suppressor-like RCC1 family protein